MTPRFLRAWLHDHPGVRALAGIGAGLALWTVLATIGVHLIYGGR